MHKIYNVTEFSIEAPYTLRIVFNDTTQQTINFFPVLHGEIFRPLRVISLFNQVYLDKEAHTLAWPNGADFDPALLHNWKTHEQEIIERSKNWDAVASK